MADLECGQDSSDILESHEYVSDKMINHQLTTESLDDQSGEIENNTLHNTSVACQNSTYTNTHLNESP